MNAAANTTVTVLRSTGRDDYGDPVDLPKPVYTRVTASIILARQNKARQDEHDPQAVDIYTGRLPHWVRLENDDRLRDERTGQVYIVDRFTQDHGNPAGIATDINLELRVVH